MDVYFPLEVVLVAIKLFGWVGVSGLLVLEYSPLDDRPRLAFALNKGENMVDIVRDYVSFFSKGVVIHFLWLCGLWFWSFFFGKFLKKWGSDGFLDRSWVLTQILAPDLLENLCAGIVDHRRLFITARAIDKVIRGKDRKSVVYRRVVDEIVLSNWKILPLCWALEINLVININIIVGFRILNLKRALASMWKGRSWWIQRLWDMGKTLQAKKMALCLNYLFLMTNGIISILYSVVIYRSIWVI